MGAEINETKHEPWKCTGGLEYGGFHPEVINHEDQCQLCNRHRHELLPVNKKKNKITAEKKKNSEEKSFAKKHILPTLNRLKYGLIAIVASAFGLNNETVKTQIQSLSDQYRNQQQQTTVAKTTPTPVVEVQSTPTPTPTMVKPEKPPEEIKKPSMIITTLPENKVVEISAGKPQVVDSKIALSPDVRRKNYQIKVDQTGTFNFKLSPINKPEEVAILVVQFLPNQPKDTLYHSHDGELKDVVLTPGEYVFEVVLMGYHSPNYELTITQK
jgi:hypothetical protein